MLSLVALVLAEQEVEHRKASVARLTDQAKPLGVLLESLHAYVSGIPVEMQFQPHMATDKPLKKGQTPQAALDDIRTGIADLLTEIRELTTAPLPSSHAKEVAHRQIDDMARKAKPNVVALVRNGQPLQFSEAPANLGLVAVVPGIVSAPVVNGHASGTVNDGIGLLAYMFTDQLKAFIDAEIDAISNDDTALLPQQRHFRMQEMQDSLLEAERDEERIVCLIEQSGRFCARRANADPRAVLEIA